METLFWGVFSIFLILIEIATVNLVSIWFIPGAILATIMAYLKISLWLQVTVFIITSIIMIPIFKNAYKKYKEQHINENLNSMIGKKALVVKGLSEIPGKVIINDVYWSAISIDGSCIPEDSIVIVENIEGNTLTVSLIKKLVD